MKAIGLLSGGLDSQLALRICLSQGIEVLAVHFRTIFCTCTPKGCGKSRASKVSEELGIPYIEINNTRDFLEVIKDPPHGYGSGMNPCIDCRILMFKKARQYMEETGAKFIITGEVLGQRPMSQHKSAMELIERESGLKGLIVRPLSARLLKPSIPELNGWIDRDKMLAHSGRSRKIQIELAKGFGMNDYPCAAGGCLLTDKGFAKRIRESFEHGEASLNDVQLLKAGRHFRILNRVKLIVGRDEAENNRIKGLSREGDVLIEPVNTPGPTALLRMDSQGDLEDYLKLAMYICAGYCDGNGQVVFRYLNRETAVNIPGKGPACDDYCRRI